MSPRETPILSASFSSPSSSACCAAIVRMLSSTTPLVCLSALASSFVDETALSEAPDVAPSHVTSPPSSIEPIPIAMPHGPVRNDANPPSAFPAFDPPSFSASTASLNAAIFGAASSAAPPSRVMTPPSPRR
jgi:hypothetical protein